MAAKRKGSSTKGACTPRLKKLPKSTKHGDPIYRCMCGPYRHPMLLCEGRRAPGSPKNYGLISQTIAEAGAGNSDGIFVSMPAPHTLQSLRRLRAVKLKRGVELLTIVNTGKRK